MKVVVVCFANTCRSPVAEALLAESVMSDPTIEVSSKGLAGGDGSTPSALSDVLHARGVSLTSPSGERLGDESHDADLLLFMERSLLREAVVSHPALWPRSFTLREFARRAHLNPPSRETETFAEWIGVLHATRSRHELLGDDPRDDVDDPGLWGDGPAFEAMVDELASLSTKVAPFLIGWSTST
jgi:protein-tyrosine phosphatase